ncbi:ABC transporter ATP-binding protein [Mycoplasmopsis pullorum]|uniref:ABC transporter ATP-binding protein n=2 Tax=Mycoplasmopsis pullorum TaxID=48003 RepID=UPI0011183129|nr:ABC transporter ATP-binding protein [Mycoplasmopsis pullorum]TNK83502.1 ABC transporter ATP-binding protein [Mycoplasmopsis pullorum]TNK85732.1 ABC transporter ATP-binding protein [Mycoplasmopsis pullorum]TNK86896.1 ABC transporter ATP-binding protein [Mycoplasmopsis pullorum]TNK88670.1 ABC transporter ATP-binding protein [Mycoplasmopsis pullorum]TNK89176.1 ABC transporter ATP-binding protein [Mycoplasmopsis pullorum]
MFQLLKLMPKKIKILVFLSVLLSVFLPFLTLLIPVFVKQFITVSAGQTQEYIEILMWKISVPSSSNLILILSLCILINAILIFIFQFSNLRLINYTTTLATIFLRNKLFEKILHLNKEDIDKLSYATIITRFSYDIRKIMQNGFWTICRGLINSMFSIIWGLVFALIIGPIYAISIVVVIPLLITGSIFAIKKLFPLYKQESINLDYLNDAAKQDINGIKLIKSFNLENIQSQKYESKNSNFRNNSLKTWNISAISWNIIKFLDKIGIIVVFIIAGFIAKAFTRENIKEEVGIIYQFISFLGIISSGVFSLCFQVNNIFRATVSSKRLIDIFEIVPKIQIRNTNIVPQNWNIKFENVSFYYENQKHIHAIKNLSFEIKENEFTAIIGETGSGKSTIISLILKEIEPRSGRITIGGIDIKKIDTKAYYEKISAVFQKSMILSGSIKYNMILSKPHANVHEIENATKMSAAEFINEYQDRHEQIIGQRGVNLSGGQRQRLAIAQAIIKNPKILILDDATSALDNKTDLMIRKNIVENQKDITLIMIAQRISTVKFANNIIVLDEGQIVGQGNHDYLMKNNEYYKEIYNSQLEK